MSASAVLGRKQPKVLSADRLNAMARKIVEGGVVSGDHHLCWVPKKDGGTETIPFTGGLSEITVAVKRRLVENLG